MNVYGLHGFSNKKSCQLFYLFWLDFVGSIFYSMTMSRSPDSMRFPAFVSMEVTVPSIGDVIVVSIFMASVTRMGSPFFICCPLATNIFTTEPDSVAPTSPIFPGSAFLTVSILFVICLSAIYVIVSYG